MDDFAMYVIGVMTKVVIWALICATFGSVAAYIRELRQPHTPGSFLAWAGIFAAIPFVIGCIGVNVVKFYLEANGGLSVILGG